MKKKEIDWFFWGPFVLGIVIALIMFTTQATKLPNGNYIFHQNIFTYFLAGLLVLCAILLIFGKVRESMGNKVNGKTFLYTAIIIPIISVWLYFFNN
jgi:bacteriorhodopsin